MLVRWRRNHCKPSEALASALNYPIDLTRCATARRWLSPSCFQTHSFQRGSSMKSPHHELQEKTIPPAPQVRRFYDSRITQSSCDATLFDLLKSVPHPSKPTGYVPGIVAACSGAAHCITAAAAIMPDQPKALRDLVDEFRQLAVWACSSNSSSLVESHHPTLKINSRYPQWSALCSASTTPDETNNWFHALLGIDLMGALLNHKPVPAKPCIELLHQLTNQLHAGKCPISSTLNRGYHTNFLVQPISNFESALLHRARRIGQRVYVQLCAASRPIQGG